MRVDKSEKEKRSKEDLKKELENKAEKRYIWKEKDLY
jgi:hypothetical protein